MVELSTHEAAALQEFWRFFESHRPALLERVRDELERRTGDGGLLARVQTREQQEQLIVHQRTAIMEARWQPYLASLRELGEQYATSGIAYSVWLDHLRCYRDAIRDELASIDATAALSISRGMDALLDIIIQQIGDAYLDRIERLKSGTEARYRALFDHSPLPMWTFDRETLQFVDVNGAAIQHYGYSRNELLQMTLADIRPPEDVPQMREVVTRASGLIVDAGRFCHRTKDGRVIQVELRANDFIVDRRSVRLVQITDVTARIETEQALRKTEDQLRHAQKMEAIGRLAGGVAHDFNNVLTVVASYACLLEESLDPGDPRQEEALEIGRAAERGSAITRQLLAVSRRSIIEPRPVDLGEVVQAFLPMLQRLVGERVAISVVAGTTPRVLADRGQLEQVLMNLAINARDAMPDGGTLVMELRTLDLDAEAAATRGLRPGHHVELAVTDRGSGMDRETQRRIFEPFFTTKEVGVGTGLGLSIVHGIVVQAGGAISVYSEPGVGTTFRIELPATEAVEPTAPDAVAAPRKLPPLRVLLVDDQASVRTVAARILREAGCTVLEAVSGASARRLCVSDEGAIDLVILDMVLPDVRGDTLLAQLREVRPATRFLQMSGYPANALPASGTALLAKPFSPSELRAAVARVCGVAGSPAVAAIASTGSRRRALIADDDRDVRRTMARMLRRAEIEVVEADSGRNAIAALEAEPFDVVVSDVHMPDGGGLDLLRAVRRIDLDVPVILFTGVPSLEAAAEAVEYGAFRYLTKPVDNAMFVKVVQHAVRAHALAKLRREAFSHSGAHAGVADRAGLEVRFDQALDELWVAFQPIVHATTGELFGVEALLRSNEPSLPNPLAMLDAATQLGRLPQLGRRVRALAAAGVASRPELVLFVNAHPDDLHDADLVDAAAPLSRIASRVVVEVTERAALDTSSLVDRITRIRALGFRLAVDDIGAGYSGLTTFADLTPEIVKIDMSLVRDVHKSEVRQRTIGALCKLCHEMGTRVVGEGVETDAERDTLVELGCDLLQGYLLGRPARDLP